LLCRHGVAVTTKLLMTSHELSTIISKQLNIKGAIRTMKRPGDSAAVQRLSTLPNIAEKISYIAPTANSGAWCIQRIKKERRPGFRFRLRPVKTLNET
jgi:hypothetical protein